jgi:nitroimidazol reductase NimA-like FMN-containing flavoprotein (pyridoxamine 5'-phosphate oxidase superfamily)
LQDVTGKLATVRNDGSSHVVPIWFVSDNNENSKRSKIGNIIFTTYSTSVKANNIRQNNRVSICIDDQIDTGKRLSTNQHDHDGICGSNFKSSD